MLIHPEPEAPFGCINPSDLTVLERARLACNTVKVLFPDDVVPSEQDKDLARDMFQALTSPAQDKAPAKSGGRVDVSNLAHYPTAALRHLDLMLSEYDYELINSAARIREYTKNKLLLETENPDGRIRIRALELLGKMRDVGLFADRVEITHRTKTDEELEQELHQKLEKFMGTVQRDEAPVEVEAPVVLPEQEIDETLAKLGV